MKSVEAEFFPVRARRAFEAVSEQIRAQLASGALAPGDRLPSDKQIAEQSGVSRSAVREALRSLQIAGLVQAQAGVNGGYFVRAGTSQGLTQAVHDLVALGQVGSADVTEVRIEMMSVAIRMACERGTPAVGKRLTYVLNVACRAIEADIANYAEAARTGRTLRDSSVITSFYHLLALATHNAAMVMLIDALSEFVREMLARIDPVPGANVVQVRRKVLRQLRERDAGLAIATLTRHLRVLNAYIEERAAARGLPQSLAAGKPR